MFGSSAACAEALATGAEVFSLFFLFGAALGRSLWDTRTRSAHSRCTAERCCESSASMHALRSGSAVQRVQSLKTEFLFQIAQSLTGAAWQDVFGRVRAIECGESRTNHIVRQDQVILE